MKNIDRMIGPMLKPLIIDIALVRMVLMEKLVENIIEGIVIVWIERKVNRRKMGTQTKMKHLVGIQEGAQGKQEH